MSPGKHVSEGLLHPHGADAHADVDVKAYPASAEETAIPSFPYREESVSYKVVVEGGVSAMATNAFDDEPEIVKEALPFYLLSCIVVSMSLCDVCDPN